MKSVKSRILIILTAAMLVLAAGCAKNYTMESGKPAPSTLGYALEALEVSKATYNLGLGIAGEMHCAKRISDDQTRKIIEIMGFYYLAHQALHVAVDAWSKALADGGDTETARAGVMRKWMDAASAMLQLTADFEAVTGRRLPVPDLLRPETISAIFKK